MKAFIFKSQDEEIALVDLHGVSSVELCNHQECIKVGFYGSEPTTVHIENDKDRNGEFLRITTAIQSMQDATDSEDAMFLKAFNGSNH